MMDRHEGVSCNNCSKVNFTGKRYKCLRCYDYDLCSVCYLANASSEGHSPKHPVQCILSKSDYDLYYGGGGGNVPLPSTSVPCSLTCPYCAQMGFTDVDLKEHVTEKHSGVTYQVICPICAAASNGDPNFMVNDLGNHLTVVHNVHNVENKRRISFNVDEQIHPRLARLTGNLRQQTNLQVIPAVRNIRSHAPILVGHDHLVAAFPPRDGNDPIDELIMQISRMQRNDGASLLEERSRVSAYRAMRAEINENRAQAARQNLAILQNAQAEALEVVKQESVPLVPGYAPLLPNIVNEDEMETITDEMRESRNQFIRELLFSAIVTEPEDEDKTN